MKNNDNSLLLVSSGTKYVQIQIEDIVYITTSNGNAVLQHRDGRQFITSKGLQETTAILPTDHFMIISRSVAINVYEIDFVDTEHPITILLKDGTEFKLSRRRQKEFFSRIQKI